MFSLIYLVALLSLFESQVYGFYDYEYHYEEFCNKHYSIDSPQYAFCEYYHAYIAYQSHEFPSMKECGTCKAFIKLLELNGHTERAVENLMNYTSKHFCKKVPTTQRSKCTTTMATYRPQMRRFISSVLSNGTFCEVLLKCRQHNETQVQPESYKFPYMSEYVHHYDEYYQYFYHAQNYPSEFSPYYFFFHFFYDEEHYHPFYFFEGFADEHEVEHHLIPYHDFELFSHNLTDFHSFYPWNIFDYFFKNYYEDNGFNFFYFFHYYMKEEAGNGICEFCRSIPQDTFINWVNSTTLNDWKQIGYSKVCANKTDKVLCHKLVDTIADFWVVLVRSAMWRQDFCVYTLKCYSTVESTPIPPQVISFDTDPALEKSDDFQCIVCKSISDELYNATQSSSLQQFALDTFKNDICVELSPTECNNTWDDKFKKLWSDISLRIKNYKLCLLNCKEDSVYNFATNFENPNTEGELCQTTESLMMGLFLSNPYNSELRTHLKEAVCNLFSRRHKECPSYFEKPLDRIVLNMIHVYSNGYLCPNDTINPGKDELKFMALQRVNNCQFCRVVLEFVNYITSTEDKKMEHIDRSLERTCKIIPHDRLRCRVLMNNYKNQIKRYLLKKATINEICSSINQCHQIDDTIKFFQYVL